MYIHIIYYDIIITTPAIFSYIISSISLSISFYLNLFVSFYTSSCFLIDSRFWFLCFLFKPKYLPFIHVSISFRFNLTHFTSTYIINCTVLYCIFCLFVLNCQLPLKVFLKKIFIFIHLLILSYSIFCVNLHFQ